ncbi:Uncharacterised protein [Serratia liquefaciens]|nr:Uncharacterised protein [Serratia liquefaciens]
MLLCTKNKDVLLEDLTRLKLLVSQLQLESDILIKADELIKKICESEFYAEIIEHILDMTI